jgi:hypothetical protein
MTIAIKSNAIPCWDNKYKKTKVPRERYLFMPNPFVQQLPPNIQTPAGASFALAPAEGAPSFGIALSAIAIWLILCA